MSDGRRSSSEAPSAHNGEPKREQQEGRKPGLVKRSCLGIRVRQKELAAFAPIKPLAKTTRRHIIRAASMGESDNKDSTKEAMSADPAEKRGPAKQRPRKFKSGERLAIGEARRVPHAGETRGRVRNTMRRNENLNPVALKRFADSYAQDSIEDHEEAERLQNERGWTGERVWIEMHTSPEHERSNVSDTSVERISPLAIHVAENLGLSEESLVLEFGFGKGADARYIAHMTGANVHGIDISQEAVNEAAQLAEQMGLDHQVVFEKGDFKETITTCREQYIDALVGNSIWHHRSHLIVQQRVMPAVADILRPAGGRLCMGIKLADSASAGRRYQIRLVPRHPYYPSMDRRYRYFRYFPKNQDRALDLVRPSFAVEDSWVEEVEGYEIDGEIEKFCYVIAKPK